MIRRVLGMFIVGGSLCSVSAQDAASKILQKHFQAAGQDLWNQISTVTVDGRWVDENYYGHRIKLTFKAPDKIRIQGTFDNKTFVEVYNGNEGWIVAPWKRKYEVQQMNPRERLLIRSSFSLGSPLYPIRNRITYGGLMDMEGTLYHTFIYEEDRIKKIFYLDRDDHMLYYEKIDIKDGSDSVLKIHEKYRTYSGLTVPTAVRFEGEELDKELVFDEVYLGLGAKDSLFEQPANQ